MFSFKLSVHICLRALFNILHIFSGFYWWYYDLFYTYICFMVFTGGIFIQLDNKVVEFYNTSSMNPSASFRVILK